MLLFVREYFTINQEYDDQLSSSSYFSRDSRDDFGYCDDSTRVVVVESEEKSVFHISISPALYGMSLIVEQVYGSMSNVIPFEWKLEKAFRLVLDGEDILLVENLEFNVNCNSFEIDKKHLDNFEMGSIGIVTIEVGRFEIYIGFIMNEYLTGVQLSRAIPIQEEKIQIFKLNNISEHNSIEARHFKSAHCKFDKDISLFEIIVETGNFSLFTPRSNPPHLIVLSNPHKQIPLSRTIQNENNYHLYFNLEFLGIDEKLVLQFKDLGWTDLKIDYFSISKIVPENSQFYLNGLSFKHIVTNLSERVDHKFMETAKKYETTIDNLGFNLLQIMVSFGRREQVKNLIEKLGYDPIEMDTLKWVEYFHNPNGISEDFLVKCLSNHIYYQENNDETSLPLRVRLIMSKLNISVLSEEAAISIQNHLIPQCYLSHYFYIEKPFKDESKVYCLLAIVVMKCINATVKLGILFGNWAIYWDDNSIVRTCEQSEVPQQHVHTIEVITSEKRLEKIARSLCESICSWNGRKLFNYTNCNSGHFLISFLKKALLWDSIPTKKSKEIILFTKNNYSYSNIFSEFEENIPTNPYSIGKSTFSNFVYQYMDCERLKEIIENVQELQSDECEFLKELDFFRDDLFLIGEGGFGKVFKCLDKNTRIWKALKVVENDIELEMIACKKFINLKHRYLAPIYDFGMFGDELFILMPYYEGGDLTTFINEKGYSISENTILQIFYQLSESLTYLHEHRIIHRDVKLKNIFVSSYEKGDISVVLGDFGCFLDLECIEDKTEHLLGSESYRPPENEQTTKADIWSLGVCILQLLLIQKQSSLNLSSEYLFNENDKLILIQSVTTDEQMREILSECLDLSVTTRITSSELSKTLISHKALNLKPKEL